MKRTPKRMRTGIIITSYIHLDNYSGIIEVANKEGFGNKRRPNFSQAQNWLLKRALETYEKTSKA